MHANGKYRLEDMADDTAGLLDALGIESAHVVGASMGGMIAQTLVIRHPERVRSLTSIMSTVGLTVGPSRQEALDALLAPPAQTRGEHEQRIVDNARIIGSPGFSFDEDRLRGSPGAPGTPATTRTASGASCWPCWPRATAPRRCARSRVPTVVIHGDSDPSSSPKVAGPPRRPSGARSST